MNAEKLMDAIGMLPGDLIAAVDKCRTNPGRKQLRPGQWLPLAACLALVLAAGLILPGKNKANLAAMGGKSEPAPQASMEIGVAEDAVMEEALERNDRSDDLCPKEEAPELTADTQEAAVHPMTLTLRWGEETLTVTSGNYSVERENPDGTMESTIACGPHPLDAGLEPILVEAEEVTLHWQQMPDTISVRRWADRDTQPEELSLEQPVLVLNSACRVYEITATWGSICTASYAVHLVFPE